MSSDLGYRTMLGENGATLSGGERQRISITIICAVNGTAVGGGMEIAVSCDLIVAVKGVRFGLPEVKVGLIASTGGLVRMARELPRKIAMELCLTGKLIYADEAKEIGIVNYVVEPEELMNKAIELRYYAMVQSATPNYSRNTRWAGYRACPICVRPPGTT